MGLKNTNYLFALGAFLCLSVSSCSDDDTTVSTEGDDYKYVGQQVGNFSAEEWYPGGELGTTENTTAACYEDETPAVNNAGLYDEFKRGELLFEHDFTETSTASFGGLGPAYVRTSCIDCHPGYGHGKRVNSYTADFRGNGYLLVIYHPTDGANGDDGSYISEVTGMPQTKAVSPFLPPVDESGIHLSWEKVTSMESGLSMTFPDGETYELIYPELYIDEDAFNTNPKPTNLAFRLESTIGLYGNGLLDAIPEDSIKAQYQKEAQYVTLNPSMWDADANDWASSAYYTLADGTKMIKRYTYALTRASLQDGAGANAMWNIPNVSRSDRKYLYSTSAWALAMSENESVINAIASDPTSPYYVAGSDGNADKDAIKECVKTLLDPNTNQFDNDYHNFSPEMSDNNFWQYMVWHRGLAVPRARDLNSSVVQRGKEVFMEIGCADCHRPKWVTGSDDYWAPSIIKDAGRILPTYPYQTIYPYTDMVQHRLYMKNGIHGSWCRTTPLWGRGLSMVNTGAEDRLHDCRARNEIEAIMWHGYSKNSDAYYATENFYNLSKSDRDAVVKFLQSI
ncbi:MAG: di-heme oxidoredictase family protein [Prevotellaceae bacterium]|nr:di-heme oxidoredictase family protein [Prevotellaceae bacterium]